MKTNKQTRLFPISQRDLAAYLGISPTLLNMTKTGRHGNRELRSTPSNKMTALMQAHLQSQKVNAPGPSLKKIQDSSAIDCSKLATRMLGEANHADAHLEILKRRLDEMVRKEQADTHWLNTVEQLLSTLPKTRESDRDRTWLEYRQVIVLKRLKKNGRLAQVKLETQIETKKANARVYREMQKKLLKK